MEGIALCMRMHNELHDISKGSSPTIYQSLLSGLSPETIAYRPMKSFSSIAWDILHITRIEDAVANILIADSEQVFNGEWMNKMNISTTDTGNAFTSDDVDKLNTQIDARELLKYRKAVGKKTQKILANINEADRKTKPTQRQLDRVVEEGVLTKDADSIWLLGFWGNKTITGLLTMPITRHQIVHINDCYKLKEKYARGSR